MTKKGEELLKTKRQLTLNCMQVGRKEHTMSSGAYPNIGSGRSFSILHLNIFFYI